MKTHSVAMAVVCMQTTLQVLVQMDSRLAPSDTFSFHRW